MSKRQGNTEIDVNTAVHSAQEVVRLHRLGRELRLTDQILSSDVDSITIRDHGPAPAWTTLEGDQISFALGRMPFPQSRTDVAVWLGTNAHELGHVLFSPRGDSPLMRRVLAAENTSHRGMANLHNIVEDQRQERLILARFKPWRAYLTAALGHHLKPSASSWVLLAGRTWLPDSARAKAKLDFAKFYGSASADDVAAIVGAYQRLTDPGDTEAERAWMLLVRLHELFGLDQPPEQGRCQVIDSGEPDTSEPADDSPAPADDDSAEPDTDAAGDGQIKAQISDDAAEQLDGNGNDDTDDQSAADDLDKIMGALDGGSAGEGAFGAEPLGEHRPVTDGARRLRHEVSRALMELRNDTEPGWAKRVDSGRLAVRRLVNPHVDMDQLFDRYQAGEMDATELEVVLLLDVSTSMRSQLVALAEAAWAIRHAVDDLEGTATVITWDDGPHAVVAAPGERPDDRMFVSHAVGGTNPASALTEAHRILSGSTARHRLAVVLTDGDWARPAQSHETIQAMNAAGITTVCALLGMSAGKHTHHECRHVGEIKQPTDLARMFGDIALTEMSAGMQ